ncbi:MAG: D-alanyl-D-alanine carboxypeptidase [Chloroflexi bacterium]|nr:D-alanyl-D-alanine carboxypeptidase [Chloroflexota bacterium]
MHAPRGSRRGSGNNKPLLVAVVVILALVVMADRLNLLPWRPETGAPASQPAPSRGQVLPGPAAAPTSTPIPARTSTSTPTPIPTPFKTTQAAPPGVSAVGAVVIDERSGAVLYDKNSRLQRAPASITKIVTAIVAIERAKPSDIVDVTYDPTELVDSTLMGLYNRDRCSLEDLLYGLMLPSGNDAALAIANHVAGSERAFADLMNRKMKDLGLQDSHFVNAHGLDAKDHYSSAHDMALVTRYAMQNPLFRQLAAAKVRSVTLWRSGEKMSYPIYNLNKLLTIYPGADGVKIGYTENALRTIVGSATKDGHRVYAALMGSTDLWTDTPLLLDYAFRNFAWPSGN